MKIVLLEPEIAPNTGNIARLCAATRSELHLIEPFGFQLDDRQLKRAGMDYWNHVVWKRWPNWSTFRIEQPSSSQIWFVEAGGPFRHSDVSFGADDVLVFGRETAGLPNDLLYENRDHWLRIPMFNPHARSLNLSNCVSIVLYEALRQQGFPGELPTAFQ